MSTARNAADAMPEGGHFRLHCRMEGPELVIVAADDGPGIPAAIRARLFELFASDKQGGTGLGLAIVKQIVATTAAPSRSTPARAGRRSRSASRTAS